MLDDGLIGIDLTTPSLLQLRPRIARPAFGKQDLAIDVEQVAIAVLFVLEVPVRIILVVISSVISLLPLARLIVSLIDVIFVAALRLIICIIVAVVIVCYRVCISVVDVVFIAGVVFVATDVDVAVVVVFVVSNALQDVFLCIT